MLSHPPTYLFWIVFHVLVVLVLFLDLFVLHRRPHAVTLKESLGFTAFLWILAALFGFWIGIARGGEQGLLFAAGYLIEYSLSVDNLFLFTLIFKTYRVPEEYKHRVLFWGVLGAIAMRAAFIFAGLKLVELFHPLLYLFGAFLVITGIRMLFMKKEALPEEQHWSLRVLSRHLPFTPEYHGKHFLVNKNGKRVFTPLALALIAVELTDLMFALDSIPAIMGITLDPLIVYTSNIMAILGLRSLYFALNTLMGYITYLHYALAIILAFVGVKLLVADHFPIPIPLSLGVIFGTLFLALVASLLKKREEEEGLP